MEEAGPCRDERPTVTGTTRRTGWQLADPGVPNAAAVPPPVIVRSPTNRVALAGHREVLAVEATGLGLLHYQWRLNRIPVTGATNATLVIDDVQFVDEGQYDVFVSNAGGSIFSEAAQLRVVEPPTIHSLSPSLTVWPGSNLTFTVSASGSAPLQYQWYRDGAVWPGQPSRAWFCPMCNRLRLDATM